VKINAKVQAVERDSHADDIAVSGKTPLSRLRSRRLHQELSIDEIINLDRELSAPLAETKRPKRSRLHVKYARNENCQWPDTTDWLGATAR
jgi:hypothetical protein